MKRHAVKPEPETTPPVSDAAVPLGEFRVTPFADRWGWRGTSRGFALIGCRQDPDGVLLDWTDSSVHDASSKSLLFGSPGELVEVLNGCARFVFVDDRAVFVDLWDVCAVQCSGPFTVDATPATVTAGVVSAPAKMRLRCGCGWAGKWRVQSARRFMVTEQSRHLCAVDGFR